MNDYPKLSGNNYVSALLNGEFCQIKIAVRCNHRDTICEKCLYMWHDYELRLEATAGGRRLRAAAAEIGVTP